MRKRTETEVIQLLNSTHAGFGEVKSIFLFYVLIIYWIIDFSQYVIGHLYYFMCKGMTNSFIISIACKGNYNVIQQYIQSCILFLMLLITITLV